MWFFSYTPPLVAILLSCVAVVGRAADRLILRNLDIISGRSVTAFDDDGVVLDSPLANGKSQVTWDRIEQGRVAIDQARFDALLKELGLPLYRVGQRLKIGDIRAAGEAAETLYGRFAEREGASAYLVCQAVMWSRLATVHSEGAVEPALRCFEALRSKAALAADLPGKRRAEIDMETGLAADLPPVWFDAAAANAALPKVEQAIRAMAQPRPVGAYLYYATLAAAAGESEAVERVLPLLHTATNGEALGDLVRAQQELIAGSPGESIERMRLSRGELPVECQSAARFVLGRADLQSGDEDRQRDGLLELLSIPAGHSEEQRDLAAAALYYAAEGLGKLNDAAGAAAVRGELAAKYAETRFGNRAREVRGK